MKVELYEEKIVQKKERFVADDGTVFDNEAECIAYEDRRKLDDMPFPSTVSAELPDGDYDVRISLLKSPLDFKKVLSRYNETSASSGLRWDLDGLDEPMTYPCAYVYYVDSANRAVWNTSTTIPELVNAYLRTANKLSSWCATQLDYMCKETKTR